MKYIIAIYFLLCATFTFFISSMSDTKAPITQENKLETTEQAKTGEPTTLTTPETTQQPKIPQEPIAQIEQETKAALEQIEKAPFEFDVTTETILEKPAEEKTT